MTCGNRTLKAEPMLQLGEYLARVGLAWRQAEFFLAGPGTSQSSTNFSSAGTSSLKFSLA